MRGIWNGAGLASAIGGRNSLAVLIIQRARGGTHRSGLSAQRRMGVRSEIELIRQVWPRNVLIWGEFSEILLDMSEASDIFECRRRDL